MTVKFTAVGASFRQASRLYQSVKEETGMGMMGSISEGDVASHCRIVCAINLQYLKEMLKNDWAFSIAIDAGNNAGTAYLDLRMRCYFRSTMQNLHLVAIPMRERHTGEYQYDLIAAIIHVVACGMAFTAKPSTDITDMTPNPKSDLTVLATAASSTRSNGTTSTNDGGDSRTRSTDNGEEVTGVAPSKHPIEDATLKDI
jgi:hypothetical protein